MFARLGVGLVRVRSRIHYDSTNSGPSYQGPTYSVGAQSAELDDGGIAVQAALGGTIAKGLVLALELSSAMFTSGGQDDFSGSDGGIKYTTAGPLVLLYPVDTQALNGGLSFGRMTSYWDHGYGGGAEASGWFAAPQLGWGDWVGKRWSLELQVRVAFARLSSSGGGSWFLESPPHTANVALPSLSIVATYH